MGQGGYRQINKTLNICAFEDYLSTQQAYLPKLENVEQLSPRVIRVLGQNAGKVFMRIEACLIWLYSRQLTEILVHTTRNKYLHRWDGFFEAHRRYRPGHPGMGRFDLFHTHHLIHRPISRIPHPLARRSHWRRS